MLDDVIQPRPRRRRQLCARAHEIQMITFQYPQRLRVQAKAGPHRMNGIDAREQSGVQVQRAPMRRQARRHLQLDRLQGVIGVRRGKVGKNPFHPRQQAATVFQRADGVGKIGRCRIAGDGGDLGIVFGQGAIIGRREMLRPDAVQRRGAEGAIPGFEKGIFHHLYIGRFSEFPRRWKRRRPRFPGPAPPAPPFGDRALP